MRTSFAIKNTVVSVLCEIIAIFSGIILPRYFISAYGSTVNGLASSIGQFITYMGLVEAGVSAAATVELYKPLADRDTKGINGILSAAKAFYIKSGVIFLALNVLLIAGYPFIVQNEIADGSFVRWMILMLSLSGLIDYFALGKYRVLLIADQRTYVITAAQAAGTLVTLIVSLLLIRLRASPILVKGVAAGAYLMRTGIIILYARRQYPFINFRTEYPANVFSQRKSALFHQVIGMICNNTDIVLLTLVLQSGALVEVSVYSAYNMVGSHVTSLFNSITNGIRASFGQVIAQNDQDTLQKSFSVFELLFFILLFLAYTCMGVMLFSFISLYSSVFSDPENYTRWSLVFLFTACGLVQNIRLPGMTIQIAAGHFRQTQGAALLEAVINLGVSLALVWSMGITGVLLGTIFAYLYRSTYVIVYNAHHFLPHTLRRTALRIVRNGLLFILLLLGGLKALKALQFASWLAWVGCAAGVGLLSAAAFFLMNYLFEPHIMRECLQLARSLAQKLRRKPDGQH